MRSLVGVAWGVARLGLTPPPMWLTGLGVHMERRARLASDPHSLSLGVWALGTLGFKPEGAWGPEYLSQVGLDLSVCILVWNPHQNRNMFLL
jgi:hypothetical protein